MRARHVFRKRAARCIALLSVAVGSTVFAPSAFANQSDCPAQYLCLWDGNTYGGARAQFHDNGWQNLAPYGFDNIASSVYNNTNRYAVVADGANGGGPWLVCLGPGQAATFNTGGFPPINNVASSVWLGTYYPC